MADPLERLTNLTALLLRAGTPLTLDQIATEMTGQYPDDLANRRARFERDKRELRQAGLVIDTVILGGDRDQAGATAYRIDSTRYELPDLGLTEDETRALNLAAAAVHIDRAGASGALAKLGASDGELADTTRPLATLPSSPALPALFEAHSLRAPVTFRYRGARDVTERTVDPYALRAQRGTWYLLGRDHGRDEVRTFRVDRFEPGPIDVGAADAFTVPEDFNPEAVLPEDLRRLGTEAIETDVWIDAARAPLLVREAGPGAVVEERADGSVVLRVPATNELAFRGWLLELGEHAEVLGPPDVRDRVVAWLEIVAAGRGPS